MLNGRGVLGWGAMLTTKSGKRVPELVFTPSLFMDRTSVLYGPSKTGKTVFVKNIMKQLLGHVEQVLVVAPTEPSNRSYDGFVDPALIHFRLHLPDPEDKKDTEVKAAMRFLDTVWKRQEMMAAIYTRANDPAALKSLYGRLGRRERQAGDRHLASLERKRRRVVADIRRQYANNEGLREAKTKEVSEKFKKLLVLLYKKFLTPHVGRLWAAGGDLSEDERYSLHYLHFNPRLLFIFDDCAAELKPFFKKEIFRKLFYQNRHSFITVVICCQDDTDLPTNLRKNAFVSIFTEPIVATSSFGRPSNKFPKSTREYVNEIVPDVFQGYRKLAYIREDDKRQHFYHATCSYPRPFIFGSDALGELCDSVRSRGVTMDTDNPFYEKFRV